MKYLYILLLMLIMFPFLNSAQMEIEIKGQIIDGTTKVFLPGATITGTSTRRTVVSDLHGNFNIILSKQDTALIVSFIGYKKKVIPLSLLSKNKLLVALESEGHILEEIVVSTGYQVLSKAHLTGAFVQIDKELIQRSTGTNILNRLQDITPGLIFNRGTVNKNDISIRGQSTIFSNTQPLIVIDNFPFDGGMDNINPNDVATITILKDAAAASIWGSRAGNGVIVITTKSGQNNRSTQVFLSSNFTAGAKPDLFYYPQMSTGDYIDIEKRLFKQGYYSNAEASLGNEALSPVIELLIANRDKTLSDQELSERLDQLSNQDIRNDYKSYLYRPSFQQQHGLSLSGGGENQKYYFSAGFDKNLDNLVKNGYDRITLSANNTFDFFNKKLSFTNKLYYTKSRNEQNNEGSFTWAYGKGLYPYAYLKDKTGVNLSVTKDYRRDFVESATSLGLLNWDYNPLDELAISDNTTNLNEYRFDFGLNYKILQGLSADLKYQYGKSSFQARTLHASESYFSRNLINTYTQEQSGADNSRVIPIGGILDLDDNATEYNNFRSQLSFDKAWNDHSLSALVGYEARDVQVSGQKNRLYGYDDDQGTNKPVDYVSNYTLYYNRDYSSQIPFINDGVGLTDRFISWYMNAGYAYRQRYLLSTSVRIDKSNLFGVNTNQKGVPLYSLGLGWEIGKEQFYNFKWLPSLKLRGTYGYNGNVNKTLSTYTTAYYFGGAGTLTNLPYAQISNAPNPELRWEKVQIVNIGIDFQSAKNIISGTFDIYRKQGIDLIGDIPFPPSTGITQFRGNVANTKGSGFDLVINTQNLNGVFEWRTNFMLSHAKDIVTKYTAQVIGNSYLNGINGSVPIEGKPLYSISGYRWAGLDPENGDPLGYLNGEISREWNDIISNATADNVIFKGSARPTYFGAIRNTVAWKNFSLSANISYRFGYYFFKESINYQSVLNAGGGHGDYTLRWKQSGDEKITHVPSIPTETNIYRNDFYTYSEALIEKGDHIRLQDIRLGYNINKSNQPRLPFRSAEFFLYASNLGILWKANNSGVDPDYQRGLLPKMISAGLRLDF